MISPLFGELERLSTTNEESVTEDVAQKPTCVGLPIQTPADAHVIFHAVHERVLRIVARRLDTEERRAISPGCIYVWEERRTNAEANWAVGLLFGSSICQLRAGLSQVEHRAVGGFYSVGTRPREGREYGSNLSTLSFHGDALLSVLSFP